jgi:hypothetical protein
MSWLGQLLGHEQGNDDPALLTAIERALSQVEPRLMQTSGYQALYQKPVAHALAYANSLAALVPGPVEINRESYAKDALVHALFPSADFVTDAFCASRALHDYYHHNPDADELYALMGMRRVEKTLLGMEYSGTLLQRDVVQSVVYFTSHTIENPASTEEQARARVTLSFFDSLVGKVKKRVEARRLEQRLKIQEKDSLVARLRAADGHMRSRLESEFADMLANIQSDSGAQDFGQYLEDFESVLLHPEQHLRLDQTPIILDRMGVKRESIDLGQAESVLFNELIDYDRRNWTVAMVHCRNMRSESFADRLEKSYRQLAV